MAALVGRDYGGPDAVGGDMFVDWLLASFHHLAVFSLAAILSAEIFLTGGPIDDRTALRLARVDAWFGILAAIALAAGLLRLFFGAKGYEY
jgi:putative membrane protein